MSAYLDCNATTPVAAGVLQAMEPWLTRQFGNASSRDHGWGWAAAEAVERGRASVADLAGIGAQAVVFTSGATEALNTVVRSYVGYGGWRDKKIIACATEHEAALGPCRYLSERTGVELKILPVDGFGHIVPGALEAVLHRAPGALVAVMLGNNEIGTIHPIRKIADLVHAADGLLLCDTTQAVGKCSVDLRADGIDFAAVSAHKIQGPKGVGALLAPAGGTAFEHQPRTMTSRQGFLEHRGTLNVPGIVGLGEACRMVTEQSKADIRHMEFLRNRLEGGILAQVPETWINGDCLSRLCNTSNVGFKGINARALIRDMHDIAVSTRSACSTGSPGPSHVLKAIGLTDEDAYSCVRFSVGRFTTQEEIDYTIGKVVSSSHKLRRSKSPRLGEA